MSYKLNTSNGPYTGKVYIFPTFAKAKKAGEDYVNQHGPACFVAISKTHNKAPLLLAYDGKEETWIDFQK